MKLKYEFVVNELAGKKVAVAVGDSVDKFNGFIKMDENTATVMECLKNDVTEDEIVAALVEKFSVEDGEELRESLRGLLNEFYKNDILEK